MDDNELNGIDENTISEDIDVVSPKDYFAKQTPENEPQINEVNPEQNSGVNSNIPNTPQTGANSQPLNTISNSVNSFKNGYQKSKELSKKVQGLKNKQNQLPTNSTNNNTQKGNQTSNNVKDKSTETKEKVKEAKDKVENKVAGKAIQAATGGAISSKNAEKLAMKAKVLLNKKKKMYAYIAIGVSIGLVLIVIVTSILMNSDDKSLTSQRTNNYVIDSSTDEELIDYMGFISICPSVKEAKEKAEEYGIELEDDKVTFKTMRKLAEIEEVEVSQTCLNAMDYYEAFQKEYVENKKACYKNRDENSEMLPNYWRHKDGESPHDAFLKNDKSKAYFLEPTGGKDKYDCQIKLPTELISETMSYDLTDQDLFNKEYLDRYDPYEEDLRKLSNALSEYVQETCYKWMYFNYDIGEWQYSPCEHCGPKTKKEHDGFYFQISFDKFVCYLKYGDSCGHPNYSGEARQKFPDLQYLEHLCTSPENDKLEKLQTEENEAENKISYAEPSSNPEPNETLQSGNGEEVAEYAQQFVGNPYVWGGTSLTDGADCSGFIKSVYEHFGISLPHSSEALRSKGQAVSSLSQAKAGDIICYSGHVALYIGGGKIVHAANSESGIKISNKADYRQIVAIRRIVE